MAWGTLATLTGFIASATEFYWIRFFLGITQAGFFPACIVYLTHWYRQGDRGKAVAMFMAAIPASNMIGAIVAAGLMRLDWFGMSRVAMAAHHRRAPSILAGIFAFFYLTDRPERGAMARRTSATGSPREIEREKEQQEGRRPSCHAASPASSARCCCWGSSVLLHHQQRRPRLVAAEDRAGASRGLSTTQVLLISAIPWLCAIPAMVLHGWHSDRTGERRWHAAMPLLLVGVAPRLERVAGYDWCSPWRRSRWRRWRSMRSPRRSGRCRRCSSPDRPRPRASP